MNALIFILLETNFWVCFGVPITAAADDHMSVSECTDVVLSADCEIRVRHLISPKWLEK